jgi:hypothetical protein
VLNYHTIKTYRTVTVELHAFLTLALYKSHWLASHYGRFTSEKMCSRAGLEVVQEPKIAAQGENQIPGTPACSLSLCRLRYPGL